MIQVNHLIARTVGESLFGKLPFRPMDRYSLYYLSLYYRLSLIWLALLLLAASATFLLLK